MRNLLRCRRGSVAFATVIALVPLIGVVALGAEAGSWYVTKQHAQNAADAAAYSGGLTLACENSASSTCDPGQDYVYRGKQFAAQNAFCNTGESFTGCITLPTGTSQSVQIERGTFAANVWTSSATGNFVRATASQQQPAYLAAVLGLSTVDIGAQAIVEIKNPKDLCALGLGPTDIALTIGGSSNITGNGCGLMSDTSVKYNSTPTFSGSGWAVNAVNGCNASAGHCALSVPYNYSMLPATNPLHDALDNAAFNNRTGNDDPLHKMVTTTPSGCPVPLPQGIPTTTAKCYSVSPNSGGTGAYKDLSVSNNDWVDFAPGTYFFYNATIKITGGTITCNTCTSAATSGVTLVLLGTTSTISMTGGTVNLSAAKSNTFSSALDGVLIDDQAQNSNASKISVNISGGGASSFGGAMYFPNADVTYGGSVQNTNTTCTEVIAKTLTISGNSYMSTQNCAAGTVAHSQVVALVQ